LEHIFVSLAQSGCMAREVRIRASRWFESQEQGGLIGENASRGTSMSWSRSNKVELEVELELEVEGEELENVGQTSSIKRNTVWRSGAIRIEFSSIILRGQVEQQGNRVRGWRRLREQLVGFVDGAVSVKWWKMWVCYCYINPGTWLSGLGKYRVDLKRNNRRCKCWSGGDGRCVFCRMSLSRALQNRTGAHRESSKEREER